MKRVLLLSLLGSCLVLASCEFSCSVGDKKDKEVKGTARTENGAVLYNNIKLTQNNVQITKAYLAFDDGERVPDDNFVDFKQGVNMRVFLDSGWTSNDGKVMLGAAEKITADNGTVVLDEKDLFQKYPKGISEKDARILSLSAKITLKDGVPPTSFTIDFRFWDKNGPGVIEGSYKLFSK